MYSLLLMTAVATGGDAPAFGGRLLGGGSCHGCSGVVASCTGYSGCSGATYHSGGCYGSSCWGSSCHGGRGGLFSGLFAGRHGCGSGSSCHGSSSWGSSCHGSSCWGSSCHGSSYSGGGCSGGWSYSGGSCNGWSYSGGGYPAGGGCYGSSSFGYSAASPVIGGIVVTSAVQVGTTPATPVADLPATVTIELPAKAVLMVDGQPVKGDGASRLFHTPPLTAGQTFYYDMTATVQVGGQTVVEDLRILIRGGETITKSFGKLIAATGADKAKPADEKKVAVK